MSDSPLRGDGSEQAKGKISCDHCKFFNRPPSKHCGWNECPAIKTGVPPSQDWDAERSKDLLALESLRKRANSAYWAYQSHSTTESKEQWDEARAEYHKALLPMAEWLIQDALKLAAASPSRQGDGWLPIETAPAKTDVLVYVPADDDLGYIAKVTEAWLDNQGCWNGCASLEDGVLPTYWQSIVHPSKETTSEGPGEVERLRDRVAFLLTALDQATEDAVIDLDGFIGESGGCNHSKYGHVNSKPEMAQHIRDREEVS